MHPELTFFAPQGHIHFTRHNLPHWQQPGATYFVTFRLGDSLPAALLDRWKTERAAWLQMHPEPRTPEDDREYHRLFSTRLEHWLDAGHGACLLRQPDHRDTVADALTHFECERYRQLAWVIMPNHVHACFALHPSWKLEKVVFSWKRHAARAINRANGVTGSLWQHDYFDRLIRDSAHFGRVIRYIRNNPIKARLASSQFTHWESDLARTL